DGIRDFHVTGVQTCALPIYRARRPPYRTAASVASVCVGDAEVLERLVRAAVPLRHDGVAHVAQILDADLRGPESRGDEIAEPVRSEERRVGKEWRTEWSRAQ